MARPGLRIWVTRAQPGADATAERLRALGHEPVVAPLLEVRPLTDVRLDLSDVGALAFSSANGVAAFAGLSGRRDLVVYAVGRATGAAAEAAGFAEVRAGDADVTALAELIASDPARPEGPVLHIAPLEPAGDLVAALATAGVKAQRVALYETTATGISPPEAVDAVLIHSPKAARALAEQARGAPLADLRVAVLSDACAAPLRKSGFKAVEVAAQPTEASLLERLRP